MEITARPAARRRQLLRSKPLVWLLLLAPVTIFAAVPTMFGLERYVVASDAMGDSLRPGTMLFERRVPVGDLEVGDVVTYARPDSPESDLVTHRIVDISPGIIRTRADSSPRPDPWLVSTRDNPTLSRVVLTIPFAGLPFLVDLAWWAWAGVALVAGAALALAASPRQPARRRLDPAPLGVVSEFGS